MTTHEESRLNRLYWHCRRRGLLELDLVLGAFLDQHFTAPTETELTAFEGLLALEDHHLWHLITTTATLPTIDNNAQPLSPTQRALIDQLNHVRVPINAKADNHIN